jgi:iron complex transport system substrate-binding protein
MQPPNTRLREGRRAPARSVAGRLCALIVLVTPCACQVAERESSLPRPAAPGRIVVMAPAAAEMLEALGATGRIVGIGDFVSDPPAVTGLPRVGAYNAPSVERILELEADLFLTSASEAATAAHRRLESLGVEVVALDTSTLRGLFESLAELGRRLDLRERADALERGMRAELEAIHRAAEGTPRRSVLFVVGREPLYVAGPGSHIDEMIALVGGVNVVGDVTAPYQRVSMEAVLERMPDVIIDASDNRADAPRGRLAGDWGRWSFLPAVRDERVWWVDPSRLVIPGMRLPEMTARMGRLIQPEAFGPPVASDLTAD